jgi:hypothetical protein
VPTYVVYERKTGRVVHTHSQPDDLPMTQETLFTLIEPKRNTKKLATLVIDPAEIEPEKLYRVNPTSKELQATKKKRAKGFGMSGVRDANLDRPVSRVEISYPKKVQSADLKKR